MFSTLVSGAIILTSLFQVSEKIEFSVGVNYSSYQLYQDEHNRYDDWRVGGEIAVHNIIPHIGLKLRGTKLNFYTTFEESYEYLPITLCTSFDLLPFLEIEWLRLSAETGLGLYNWKGYWIDQVIVLPSGERMEEWDIGFVGGFTVQVRPVKYLGIEYAMRYNYMASAEIYKYGFDDKDDKIWENGIGVKFIFP